MRYGSLARKLFKVRWGLYGKGLVEDHHIIPKQFKKHPIVVKAGYDIDAGSNLIMLPTRLGKFILHVREDRLIHEGIHTGYNKYIESMLNSIKTTGEFIEFTMFLKNSCRHRPQDIPWS
jgi:hypothetical protein|tara:strand:- start:231 stop:587 length:357 start_codon:yes stop_codon:yes gene_type:complete